MEQLKSREIDILRLMADGRTNREIAVQLHISVETVRWYAKRIYAKLNVSGRAEATQQAQKQGLLKNPEPQLNIPSHAENNLPRMLTSFVGRDQHIHTLIQLLVQNRLLTLTGSGGTGKTRLGIEFANRVLDKFQDGVYFVDLTPIKNSEDVAKTIAGALGIIEGKDESIFESLQRILHTQRMLLFIDNFEHVMDAAMLVARLLATTQHLKILITSREILRLSGEQEYYVPPLSMDCDDCGTLPEALNLFVQRAQQVQPHFELNDDNQDEIIEICKRVDNLPLAIELAAARCKLMSPHALLQKLDNRLTVLTGGARDMPTHHQTLRATIDWSYELLDDHEKQLFSRMAVFRSGATLDAIEIVCSDDLAIDLLDGLASLMDKSMIQQQEDATGELRFLMLEILQEYAYEQLKASQQLAIYQRRHATFFMNLAEEAAPAMQTAGQEWWFTKLDIEQNNFHAATTWALSGGDAEIGLRIIAALRNYWWFQGLHGDGWRCVEAAMKFADAVSDKTRADVLLTGAYLSYFRLDFDVSRQFAQQALNLYQSLDDQLGIAWSWLLPSIGRGHTFDESVSRYQANLDAIRELDDLSLLALKLNSFALLYMEHGDYEKADSYFRESLKIARQTGDKRHQTTVNGNLGDMALRRGDHETARHMLIESMTLGLEIDFAFSLHDMLWITIILLYQEQQIEAAQTLWGATTCREDHTGQRIYPNLLDYIPPCIEHLRAYWDTSPHYQAAYDRGYQMTLEEAVQFALTALADE